MAKQSLQTRITTFLRTEKTKRDALQALLVEAIEHGKEHNSWDGPLSALISGLIELKSRNTNAIREYIREHVSGISWQKNKSGVFMYKVTGDVSVKAIEYPWYAHKSNLATSNNKEVSLSAVKAYFKSLQKRMEENGVKAEDSDKLNQLIAQAEGILSA